MCFIFNCTSLNLCVLLAAIVIGTVAYFKWSFKYWERLNVPYIRPRFPLGTLSNPFWSAEAYGVTLKGQYLESKRNGYKHVGLFTFNVPTYMPIDLEILKGILTKDFNCFADRGFYLNETDDLVSAHLFAMEGEKWKRLRAKLTAAFSSFLFFFAGYETSSSTIAFSLYELSDNQDIQEKVRQEINSVLDDHGGVVTYEAIKELKYLNQTVEEVLRKYPPVPMLNRKCLSDYKVPNTDFVIEKDTVLTISLLGLHYDAEYFPEPDKFDPERFSEENKKKIPPYAYMPFGEGPRICIGLRFGLMQTLIALSLLLQNFRFSLSGRTRTPLRMSPLSLMLTVVGDIWLDVEKL